ncbi:hypothetical protein [Streptomyces fructofermentans]|nr:hypothetical protein [Streptomyces fructofermentans]
MSETQRVVVSPPSSTSGRRVRVDGESIGLAHSLDDLTEFLRRAGLTLDPATAAVSPLIDWRGVGPEYWGPETHG